MTTIIREGQYLYTDSRYGSYYGGYRVHDDGPCKISRSRDGSCVIGMAGCYEPTIPFDLLNEAIEEAVRLLNNRTPHDTLIVGDKLREFYKGMEEKGEYHNYQILVCNPKGTFRFDVDDDNDFGDMFFPPEQHLAIGSGAVPYVPFRKADIPIEEKFRLIYSSDEHSGGNINRFDINQLVEIAQ
jgi:hypothetical protein